MRSARNVFDFFRIRVSCCCLSFSIRRRDMYSERLNGKCKSNRNGFPLIFHFEHGPRFNCVCCMSAKWVLHTKWVSLTLQPVGSRPKKEKKTNVGCFKSQFDKWTTVYDVLSSPSWLVPHSMVDDAIEIHSAHAYIRTTAIPPLPTTTRQRSVVDIDFDGALFCQQFIFTVLVPQIRSDERLIFMPFRYGFDNKQCQTMEDDKKWMERD